MTNEELIERHHVDQVRRGLLPNSIDKRDRSVTVFARSLDGRSLLEATRDDVEQLGIDHAEACSLPELEGEEDETEAEVVREAERILGLG